MKSILRIFDAWHHSFALISFCVSVAFLIVLTGFLRTGHWLLVLALSIVICAAGLACYWVVRYLADLRRSAILAQTYEKCDYGVVISGLDGGVTQVNRAAKEQGFSIEPGSIDRVLPKAYGDLAPTGKFDAPGCHERLGTRLCDHRRSGPDACSLPEVWRMISTIC
jgi:hypothetical protein